MNTTTSLEHHNVAVSSNTHSSSTPQYWAVLPPHFAQPRHGNKASFYTTGEDFMRAAADAIRSATKFLLFVDWQMDFDVELTDRGTSNHPARFSEMLADQLDRHAALEVRILLYDSVESPAYTHENDVRKHLQALNKGNEKRVQVVFQKPNTGRDVYNIAFSHHQKLIVVDGKLAFVGGMDITYGRWDNNNFDVVADPLLHRINDMYNPGLGRGRLLTAEELKLVEPNMGRPLPANSRNRPGFSAPYYLLTTLASRIRYLWSEGKTLEEMSIYIDMISPTVATRRVLEEQYKALIKKLARVEQVYRDYSIKKQQALEQLKRGDIGGAARTSGQADAELLNLAARMIGRKLDAMRKSLEEGFESMAEGMAQRMADARYYAEDPKRLIDDAKVAWAELENLPNFIRDQHTLEEGCQPRMPWQDVHARIAGPAVYDLYKNIARRWNVALKQADNRHATPMDERWLARQGGPAIFGNLKAPDGQGVSIQVLRSMPQPMVAQELATPANAYLLDGQGEGTGPTATVLESMVNCIKSAQAYVYIETQFFISACGASDKNEPSPATNPLITALAARVAEAVVAGKGFHVYVVLPVHPEGNLEAGPVAKQHYWNIQTIKHGKKSLLKQVCGAIVRKRKGSQLATATEAEVNASVEAGDWRPYFTFLNLRNWGMTALFERQPESGGKDWGQRILEKELGRFVITEQIYVHSKLMIVDDAVAIIGSANVNDRSLMGTGDSEIAVVIRDNDAQHGVDLGNGVPVTTRKFARELRMALWRKHLGMSIERDTFMRADRKGADNSQSGLPKGRELPHPPREKTNAPPFDLTKPAGIRVDIQSVARRNAILYSKVFKHTPRNEMRKFKAVADCWPKRISKSGVVSDIVRTGIRVGGVVAGSPEVALLPAPNLKSIPADYGAEPPALADDYMDARTTGTQVAYAEKVHSIDKAREALLPLVGFFVEMPLDFGVDETNSRLGGAKGDPVIASLGTDVELPSIEAFEERMSIARAEHLPDSNSSVNA